MYVRLNVLVHMTNETKFLNKPHQNYYFESQISLGMKYLYQAVISGGGAFFKTSDLGDTFLWCCGCKKVFYGNKQT